MKTKKKAKTEPFDRLDLLEKTTARLPSMANEPTKKARYLDDLDSSRISPQIKRNKEVDSFERSPQRSHATKSLKHEKTIISSLQQLGFSLHAEDLLTGKSFLSLAKQSFDKKRPYCFAMAIGSKTKSSFEPKIFMDGSSYLTPIDEDKFRLPEIIPLRSGESLKIKEVHFFSFLEDGPIEKIGSIQEILKSPNYLFLHDFICQEENRFDESIAWRTDISIAGTYDLGLGVARNRAYAIELLSQKSTIQKKEVASDLFSFAAMAGDDLRFAKFLLDNDFDPLVRDPNDEMSAIDTARRLSNFKLLALFERYGFLDSRR